MSLALALKRMVKPAMARTTPACQRAMSSGFWSYLDPKEQPPSDEELPGPDQEDEVAKLINPEWDNPGNIDIRWFDGLPEGQPIENPIKPGLLFPPELVAPQAPTRDEVLTGKVVLPIVVDGLEWTLSSPPPVHQFEEPPIIVEFPETGEHGH